MAWNAEYLSWIPVHMPTHSQLTAIFRPHTDIQPRERSNTTQGGRVGDKKAGALTLCRQNALWLQAQSPSSVLTDCTHKRLWVHHFCTTNMQRSALTRSREDLVLFWPGSARILPRTEAKLNQISNERWTWCACSWVALATRDEKCLFYFGLVVPGYFQKRKQNWISTSLFRSWMRDKHDALSEWSRVVLANRASTCRSGTDFVLDIFDLSVLARPSWPWGASRQS